MTFFKRKNLAMDEKLGRIQQMINFMRGDLVTVEFIDRDAAVVVEMATTMTVSRRCNHYSSKKTFMHTYERSGSNSPRIPSYIEQMSISMTTSPNTESKKNMRIDPPICACVHDCLSIFEFMKRTSFGRLNKSLFLHTHSLMVTHAAVVAVLFEKLFTYYRLDEVVNLVMLINEEMFTAMRVYAGRTTRVTAVIEPNVTNYMHKVMSSSNNGDTTMSVEGNEASMMAMFMTKDSDISIDMLTRSRRIKAPAAVNRAIFVVSCKIATNAVARDAHKDDLAWKAVRAS
ncbi:LOW QUALITY PROTEIN: polyketide synthase [Colletotrichum tofieldiae]|nr:LOW QUALITY PROTEIN: polyketide synthase [Colletotrichum tofieldiae]GKT81173.1 LOW QUALITY PROTEIN: polyketide synthase [Colletotrichum tofieldiae]